MLKGGYLLLKNPSKEIMFATEETTATKVMQLTQSNAGKFRIAKKRGGLPFDISEYFILLNIF